MLVKEINNKEVWESFLLGCNEKTFLSSWNWGEFQKKIEEKIWRLGIYDGAKLIAVALVIKVKAKRGTFLFIPHGPVMESRIKNYELRILLNRLKEIAKDEGASFIRVAPIWLARRSLGEGGGRNEENIKIFRDLGFRQAPIHMHPEVTWELELTPLEKSSLTGLSSSENDLLMQMRKTTRYLIRQAEKNPDIEVVKTQNIEDLEKFNEIYSTTAKRHKFVPFSLDYFKKQFSCFLPDNQISMFFGKYKGELISAAIVIYWQGNAFYHHGASLASRIPVSYLLQWQAIKGAKLLGCKKYNFWGIASEDKKNHPWAGLTLFKKGFGGYKKEYVKTQDLPLNYKYWLTYIFEKIRKTKRGL